MTQQVDENDPSVQVRSDLWSKMTLSQLNKQRELLLDKSIKIQSIMGAQANPSLLAMYSAVQRGMDDINQLIDYKTEQNRTA